MAFSASNENIEKFGVIESDDFFLGFYLFSCSKFLVRVFYRRYLGTVLPGSYICAKFFNLQYKFSKKNNPYRGYGPRCNCMCSIYLLTKIPVEEYGA